MLNDLGPTRQAFIECRIDLRQGIFLAQVGQRHVLCVLNKAKEIAVDLQYFAKILDLNIAFLIVATPLLSGESKASDLSINYSRR
nr:hypothetical protein DWF04_07905 [Cereibacter sphaeroides f. sp. denitrificans]